MNSTSASDQARDAVKEARDGVHEAAGAASAASGDIQRDLQALRDDLGRLAEQVADIFTDQGNAVWQRAKSSVDDAVTVAQDRGSEAVGAVRDVSDNFVEAIDESLKRRPYTTLALAAALGFIFGATWKR
jgi:ElaB/YqjD/DUF883 family membrane-anchored ribosome-binding protein